MHFMVGWDFRPSSSEDAATAVKVLSCFSGAKFERVFDNLYVLKVDASEQYNDIHDRLIDLGKSNPRIDIVVTPVMSSGRYRGWLPKELWPKLRALTDGDA